MAYSAVMRFVETPVFTRELRRWLDDEHYRALQNALLFRPEQGAVIRGSGGLRKLRWAGPDTGKRGGLRVIYYWATAEEAIFMLFIYSKGEQGDLTPSQVKILGRLVREEFR
jgi:mRNA-degrading endonuclease RelE of RelBE toxin-antitoxin system